MDPRETALDAARRIRPYVRETYLEPSPYLSEVGRPGVWCKLENLQVTGSFKARGAANKLLSLTPEERNRGVVAASTGNHGAAVAYAAGLVDTRAIVFVPNHANASKLDSIRRFGAEIRFSGNDCVEAERHARQYAAEHGMAYVSPYNDPVVVAGQGTIAVELTRQLDGLDTVFVSLGGGGLISGIAGYLKVVTPGVRIVGCSPENSKVMIESIRAGRVLDLPSLPTLSDGTAGGVEAGAVTLEMCRRWVDDYVTVSEDEIKASLRSFIRHHHMLVEGSAAVAVAAFLKSRDRPLGDRVVIVICGANIGVETLKKVL